MLGKGVNGRNKQNELESWISKWTVFHTASVMSIYMLVFKINQNNKILGLTLNKEMSLTEMNYMYAFTFSTLAQLLRIDVAEKIFQGIMSILAFQKLTEINVDLLTKEYKLGHWQCSTLNKGII